MLSTQGVTKSYGNLEVLKGIDLHIRKGEVVSIVGASGAGKSTLLHILGTLDKPDKGSVYFQEKDISRLSGNELARFRNRHIGFVFQFHNLLPEFTALENVCIPAWLGRKPEKEVLERGLYLLELLGLKGRIDHKPSQLSGGEAQRTAVARALINSPDIVFADEPSGNLDSANAQELHRLFFDLREQFGQTFVIVTHNPQLAQMADRTIEMKDGKVLDQPQS
jgi:lipoprotein-releasing system ATP-binding protein